MSAHQFRLNCRLSCATTALLAVPTLAHAEPSASQSHVPFLWILAVGSATLLSWITVRLFRSSRHLRSRSSKWVLGLVLFAVYLALVAPLIVALGSILITGRTM